MVDTGDLKSPACKSVRVRVSSMADEKAGFTPAFFHLQFTSRLETSDGNSREKAPVERFQRRRGSGASSLVHGISTHLFEKTYVTARRNSQKDRGILKKMGVPWKASIRVTLTSPCSENCGVITS